MYFVVMNMYIFRFSGFSLYYELRSKYASFPLSFQKLI
jgi:hypothetical protein